MMLWHTGKSKRVPSELTAQTLRKMDMLNRAKELKVPLTR